MKPSSDSQTDGTDRSLVEERRQSDNEPERDRATGAQGEDLSIVSLRPPTDEARTAETRTDEKVPGAEAADGDQQAEGADSSRKLKTRRRTRMRQARHPRHVREARAAKREAEAKEKAAKLEAEAKAKAAAEVIAAAEAKNAELAKSVGTSGAAPAIKSGLIAGQTDRPPMADAEPQRGRAHGVLRFLGGLFKSLVTLALIALPVVLAGYYYFVLAADRYEVSTVFLIRNASLDQQASVATILGQPQSFGRAADESFSVVDYVTSYEGMQRLSAKVDLRSAFSRPKGDPFYYLSPDVSETALHEYFLSMIDANYDQITGLVTIDVRAFRARDAFAISAALLEESERLVNEFNLRAEADLLRLSREEVAASLQSLEQSEGALTAFRQANNVIDPMEVIVRVNGIITQMEGEIALARAELLQLGNVTGNRGSQVQRLELEAKIDALQEQADRERERLIGEQASLGNLIPEFEFLSLRKLIAGEAYSASLVSLQNAIGQAQRQQLYVVPVIAPTEPDEAQYPRRWENVFFVFLASLIFFTIGRLLILGIRDHIL
ncbi:MAG: hypothetical protein Kilf2KO_22280 [Rhodospirillales bacterium]